MRSVAEVRKKMRAKRRALSLREREVYAYEFAHRISRSEVFINAKRVAFYFANDGEVDLWPLIEIAWLMKKRCFVPVLLAPFVNRLMFAECVPESQYGYNKFGIAEPLVAATKRIRAHELDLVLTPLVAFDRHGARVGMGGGFYDRTFGFLQHRQRWIKPRLIGVAYPFQEVSRLRVNAWDVPLHAIATHERIVIC